MMTMPSVEVANKYFNAGSNLHLCATHLNKNTLLSQALEHYRTGLRMHLIVSGRNDRPEKREQKMLQILSKLPQEQSSTEKCMFCGEQANRADMTLRTCTNCN